MMDWFYDDGGRGEAGYKGQARDCFARAVAIAAELPYRYIYELVSEAATKEHFSKKRGAKSSARTGVYGPTMRRFMQRLGWKWTPTMHIGSGCTVHLRTNELPAGRLVVSVSRHVVAVINGAVHDVNDCTRNGMRCVYGFWSNPNET